MKCDSLPSAGKRVETLSVRVVMLLFLLPIEI